MLTLPAISLIPSDYPRLERLARVAAQQGDMDAGFLMVEITRAGIVPDDAENVGSTVTIGSWVTYWTNWGLPRKTMQLVWPEDLTSDLAQISVLSPLGAALIGLRIGDQMAYFVARRMNVVRIERVNRCGPNIIPLGPLLRVPTFDDSDPDPEPTAA